MACASLLSGRHKREWTRRLTLRAQGNGRVQRTTEEVIWLSSSEVGVWWYKFYFAGQPIRESSKSMSKTVAKNTEQQRRRELETGFHNIREIRQHYRLWRQFNTTPSAPSASSGTQEVMGSDFWPTSDVSSKAEFR
jgi:hypothetical protein